MFSEQRSFELFLRSSTEKHRRGLQGRRVAFEFHTEVRFNARSDKNDILYRVQCVLLRGKQTKNPFRYMAI